MKLRAPVSLLHICILVVILLTPCFTFAQTPSSTPFQVPPAQNPAQNRILDREGTYTYLAPIKFFIEGNQAEPAPGEVSDKKTISLVPSAANGDTDPFARYIRRWFQFLIGLSGVVAVVRLVMTGIKILGSAGSVDAKKEIKGELTAIITSLLLVAGSWVFLNTLNPALVTQNLLISKQSVTVKDKLSSLFVDNKEAAGTKIGYTYAIKVKNANGTEEVNYSDPVTTMEDCIRIKEEQKKDLEKDGASAPDGTTMAIEGDCIDNTKIAMPPKEKENRATLESAKIFPLYKPCGTGQEGQCSNTKALSPAAITELINFANTASEGKQQNCSPEKVSEDYVEGKPGSCFVVFNEVRKRDIERYGRSENIDAFAISSRKQILQYFNDNATYIIGGQLTRNGVDFSYTRYYINGWWYNAFLGTGSDKDHRIDIPIDVCKNEPGWMTPLCGSKLPPNKNYVCGKTKSDPNKKCCKMYVGGNWLSRMFQDTKEPYADNCKEVEYDEKVWMKELNP